MKNKARKPDTEANIKKKKYKKQSFSFTNLRNIHQSFLPQRKGLFRYDVGYVLSFIFSSQWKYYVDLGVGDIKAGESIHISWHHFTLDSSRYCVFI